MKRLTHVRRGYASFIFSAWGYEKRKRLGTAALQDKKDFSNWFRLKVLSLLWIHSFRFCTFWSRRNLFPHFLSISAISLGNLQTYGTCMTSGKVSDLSFSSQSRKNIFWNFKAYIILAIICFLYFNIKKNDILWMDDVWNGFLICFLHWNTPKRLQKNSKVRICLNLLQNTSTHEMQNLSRSS